jgi:hypothetical protein
MATIGVKCVIDIKFVSTVKIFDKALRGFHY